jgi:hypothetical protein
MERAPSTRAGPWALAERLGGVVAAAAGAWVFHGALGQFFAADDFPALARAAGMLPRLASPWRLLSGQLYFDLLRPLAGLDPRGYHAAGLLLHAGCCALLFALLRRRVSAPAALVGTAWFATHPAHTTALYWVSGVGGPLSLLLTLATVALVPRPGRERWLAVPLFAAALLARESVLLLPLALWAMAEPDAGARLPGTRRALDPLLLALAAVAVADGVYLVATDALGAAHGSAAYRLGGGDGMLANLFTYLGWSADFLLPTVRRFLDAVDPLAWSWGAGLALLGLAGAFSPGLRRRGWLGSWFLYLALLLPMLPLVNHTYHYYLYAPLAGLAGCVAAACDWLGARLGPARTALTRGRRTGGKGRARPARGAAAAPRAGGEVPGSQRLAWALALAASALFTLNGALLVRKIETMPFPGAPALRSDSTVDRARIARNAITSLGAARLAPHTRLIFWSPIARSLAVQEPGGGVGESYFERNVRAALFDGLAVRLFFPAVDSVGFTTAYRPGPDPYRWAVYRPDGRLGVASSTTLDSLLAGAPPAR